MVHRDNTACGNNRRQARELNERNEAVGQANLLNRLIPSLKLIAFGVGIMYLSGFLVVANHLSRFGVSTFSIFQLQYLLAGVWAFGPFILLAVVQDVQRRFEQRIAPYQPAILFNSRRSPDLVVFSGVPFGLSLAVLASLPGFWIRNNVENILGLALIFPRHCEYRRRIAWCMASVIGKRNCLEES